MAQSYFRSAAVAAVPVLALALSACGAGPTGPTATPAPQVFSVSPSRGPVAGGTSLRISGANFAAGASVTIGGVAAKNVSVESASAIVAMTDQHAAGASDITVSVSGRSGTLPGGFTYEGVSGAPPVVTAIVARGMRQNEPAAFADLGEEINVTATVQDPDTPSDQLTFDWTGESGTFTGSGGSVKWRAPAQATTPGQVKLTLTVSDRTGNVVSSTTSVGLHDSIKEVGDLARLFLLDFSNSTIRSPDVVVRNFSTSARCEKGRSAEFEDVVKNRYLYSIESSVVGSASVNFQFAGKPCSYKPENGDACAAVPTVWQSLCLVTNPECVAGQRPRVEGIDYVTAVFEQPQWKLCASNYGPPNR
jgi:hypothetical protein